MTDDLLQAIQPDLDNAAALTEAPLPEGFQRRMKYFAQLQNARRDLEAALGAVERLAAVMEPGLLEEMSLAGIENLRCVGLTLFPRTDRYVSKCGEVETQTICDVLTELGMGYMVKDGYSAQSLKSKVAEWINEGHEVPPRLAGLLNIGTVTRLGSRK